MTAPLKKTGTAPAPLYPARNLAEMSARLGVAPAQPKAAASAAAWPTGVSLLAQIVDACQRCEAEPLCSDWLVRAPEKVATPPAFCPNADALKHAKR